MNHKNVIMNKCIEEAKKSIGYTKSNPIVGACVYDFETNNEIYGHHVFYGGPHAEVNAIDKARTHIKDLSKSTIFVTLEPCSTYGKTPPCVEKIIESGIKSVVIGVLDPNPKHAGRGVNILRNAGINVEYGVNALECANILEDFIKFHNYKLPYITLKTAVSIDGKIATRTNDSKWITSSKSREIVHQIRSEHDAVLTGINTVLSDDPLLTDRREIIDLENNQDFRQPTRVVLDSNLRIPVESNLLKSLDIAPVIVFALKSNLDNKNFNDTFNYSFNDKLKELEKLGVKVILVNGMDADSIKSQNIVAKLDINEVLKELYNLGYMRVLVEAGREINGSFFDNNLVDRLEQFIAPKIIGGRDSLSAIGGLGIDKLKDAITFKDMYVTNIGEDIRVTGIIKDYSKEVVDFTRNYKTS